MPALKNDNPKPWTAEAVLDTHTDLTPERRALARALGTQLARSSAEQSLSSRQFGGFCSFVPWLVLPSPPPTTTWEVPCTPT